MRDAKLTVRGAAIGLIIGLAIVRMFAWNDARVEASTAPVALVQSMALGQVDITDPEAIKYINEVIRPLAEKYRNLDAENDAALITWFALISAKVANDASDIVDGREDEGVSRLVGSDVVGFVTQMLAYQTQMDVAGVAEVVSKPTVRTLRVQ